MAPPIAETNGAPTKDNTGGTSLDTITITGFYSRDIRFPVRSMERCKGVRLTLARHLCKMRDPMP